MCETCDNFGIDDLNTVIYGRCLGALPHEREVFDRPGEYWFNSIGNRNLHLNVKNKAFFLSVKNEPFTGSLETLGQVVNQYDFKDGSDIMYTRFEMEDGKYRYAFTVCHKGHDGGYKGFVLNVLPARKE